MLQMLEKSETWDCLQDMRGLVGRFLAAHLDKRKPDQKETMISQVFPKNSKNAEKQPLRPFFAAILEYDGAAVG